MSGHQGIRGLEPYLRERKLLQTAPLAALANTRLGIDASVYLRNLLSDPSSREPLIASTGGLPLALGARIENDLRAFEKLAIRPVFVFPGLPTTTTRQAPKAHDPAVERERAVKSEAWAHYENGEVERSLQCLTQVRGGAWVEARDVMRLVLRTLRHRMVEYMVAPYLQQAQLAYLLQHPKGYIHAVHSTTDALLWPVDRLIVSLDLTASTFTFVEKPRVLAEMGLSDEQFLDMGILAGFPLSRTFPPMAGDYNFRAVLDLVKQFRNGIAACQAWRGDMNSKPQTYLEQFMRARLAVKYSLIFTTEGTCQPLPLVVQPPGQPVQPSDVPNDLDEIFSSRLPDEVYYHICRGLVCPQVIGWLTTGSITEPPPLAEVGKYSRYVKDVITEGHTSPRCTALALLADALHPQWKTRRVGAHYYFDPLLTPAAGSQVQFDAGITQSLVARCLNWRVPTPVIEHELRRQASSTIDIKLCVGALATEELAALTKTTKNQRPLDKKDEVVANVIWRFLDVRGFVLPDHGLSTMGKALHAGNVNSRVNDRFQEAIYLLLELIRAGVIHGDPYTEDGTILSGGPSIGTEEEQRSVLLIMRCLSVLQLNFRPQQWSGPLSRELLVCNSFARVLVRALRMLLEAISVHILLSGDARRNRDDLLDLCLSLPFQSEPNTGFGILAKTYLDAATIYFGDTITEESVQADAGKVAEAKGQALKFIEQSFESVKGPVEEVKRGFRFWDAVMSSVRSLAAAQGPSPALSTEAIKPEVVEQFERADQWLKAMRP